MYIKSLFHANFHSFNILAVLIFIRKWSILKSEFCMVEKLCLNLHSELWNNKQENNIRQ